MQASTNKLYSQLLRSGDKRFLIPVYQRNYSWTENECQMLINDIMKLYDNVYQNHFMGSIIYKVEEGNSECVNVIDGQQRLSTMFLLCKAIHDQCEDEQIKQEMNDILFNRWSKEVRLVPVKSDNEIYSRMVQNEFYSIQHKENRMYQNYIYFKNFFRKQNIDFKRLIQSLEKLEVIVMELHSEDNPQVIFESINSTGLNLTNADLIRNYLLLDHEYEIQNQLYTNYWYKFEISLGYDNINLFFEHFLNIVIKNQSVSRLRMYQLFKEYCNKNSYTAIDVLKKLDEYVDVYKCFVNSDIMYELENENNTKLLNKYLDEIESFGVNVTRLFLTEVLLAHKKGVITDEDVIYTFELTISYVFRRAVCNYPTSALQKLFRFLFSQVEKHLGDVSYIESLNHNLITTKSNTKAKFPEDGEFFKDLSERNLYGKFKYLRYLLLTLENVNNKTIMIDDEITIEHIMPQKATNYWKEILGDDHKEIHPEIVDDLGNLTLTSYNSNLSNKSFEEKLGILQHESHFKLNQYFNNIKSWGADEIKNRGEHLASKAIKIWKYPDLGKEIEQIIENKKYKKLTFQELYDDYDSNNINAIQIGDDYSKEINTFRELWCEIIKYCYKIDSVKFENVFVDNSNYTRKHAGEEFYIYSKKEESVAYSRYLSELNIYIDINKSGVSIMSLCKKILDEYSIDTESVVLIMNN